MNESSRLLGEIRKAGPEGVSGHRLCRKTQWLDAATRRELLRSLVAGGLVTVGTIAGRTKPTTVYVAAQAGEFNQPLNGSKCRDGLESPDSMASAAL